VFFNGDQWHALVDGEKGEEQDEDWAQEFSVDLSVADAFRSVLGITVAPDKPNARSATARTAGHKGKTENRSNSTWIGTGSRN